MKIWKILLASLCAALVCAPVALMETNVTINATNFPDANFRAYVQEEFDKNGDGKLSEAELDKADYIYVEDKGITTLKGVEFFTALEYLNCEGNQLSTLDVSKNVWLNELNCSGNQLTSLDVSKNAWLDECNCSSNRLTSLDVSQNARLHYLNCDSNQLTSLDVSKNPRLDNLACEANRLTSLDVSKNKKLYAFGCSSNRLTSLDVSQNAELHDLDCRSNQLTTLSLGSKEALSWLHCESNKLKTLDISRCPVILKDYRAGGKLDSDGVMRYGGSSFSADPSVTIVSQGSSGGETTGTLIAVDAAHFPDEKFRDKVQTYDLNGDGSLSETELRRVTRLSIYNDVVSLKGIEYFTELKELDCGSNQLTTLDVSRNTKLQRLDCRYNQLTKLDVSKNTALVELHCYSNQLTALNVSKNTALIELDCSSNQLTALDVSKNTALTELDCVSNHLTALDVSKNAALYELNCASNQLTLLDVSKNTKLDSLNCSNNQLTALDVSKNAELYSLNCASNPLTALDLRKCPYLKEERVTCDAGVTVRYAQLASGSVAINAANFPDDNFRQYIQRLDTDGDSVLSESEIGKVTELDVSGNNIASLKGIEYFVALEELYCNNNRLTALDVSKNTKLYRLYCHSNQLKTLNLGKNTRIDELGCYDNQLTSLDVSGCPELDMLYCSDNKLTSLDVSKNVDLVSFHCEGNPLTKLDVTGCPIIMGLLKDEWRGEGKAYYRYDDGSDSHFVVGKGVVLNGGKLPARIEVPKGLGYIGKEAFADTAVEVLEVTEDITIDSKAFANCDKLVCVRIDQCIPSIASDAFKGCDHVIIATTEGAIASWARAHGIPCAIYWYGE